MAKAAFAAADYKTGRATLTALHNALSDAASAGNMTDRVLTRMALSSLYLHLGDGPGASRVLVHLLADVAEVRAAGANFRKHPVTLYC